MSIQIGDILGEYQVTGVLGRGGMGKVFRVRHLLTDREEAMKVVLPDRDDDPALADRFLREMKVHASLQHPNIANLRTAMRIADRLIMIVELVDGASLEAKMRSGRLDAATAVRYSLDVLAALEYAHQRGVIHRDIKPANILIAAAGEAKLTDFGIARSGSTARLTGTGLAVGTPAYMSPEQIRAGSIDGRSDLYCYGLTLWEMVTGRRAVQAETEHGIMTEQLEMVPPEPSRVNPLVPAGLSAVVMRALRKQPGERFQSARDFTAALRQAAPEPFPAGPPPAEATTVTAPELAQLEASFSRIVGPIARRMVPDAARRYATVSQIRQALAGFIEDPAERAAFLNAGREEGPCPTVTSGPAILDPAMMERVAQALAPYLGPIAKVLVSRTAHTTRTPEEFQQALAAEIPSVEDRRRFLASVRATM